MQVIPHGIFNKVPLAGGVSGFGRFFPLSLGNLELYLDTGIGLTSVTDGSQVSTWPDASGHSPTRDAVSQAGWNNPVMRRSGAGLVSPKGMPTVQWALPDNPTPQGLGSAGSIGSWPVTTNGYTLYWYGQPHQKTTPAWNFVNQPWFSSDPGAGTQVTGVLDTGGVPQSYGFQDNAGGGNPHRFGTTASIVDTFSLHTLLLPPPNNNTVPCRYFINAVEVAQVSGPANWLSSIGTGQYFIGNAVTGTVSMRAEAGFWIWYSTLHSLSIIQMFEKWKEQWWG